MVKHMPITRVIYLFKYFLIIERVYIKTHGIKRQ